MARATLGLVLSPDGRERPGPERRRRAWDRDVLALWVALIVLCVLFWIGVAVSVVWLVQRLNL